MLNHITIMGRLTRDPEHRVTGTGISVANFSVAVDRDFTSQGQEKETDFIDCVAWRKTAEFVTKYFLKGSMVVVSGRLQMKSWTDKDGNKSKSYEIVADNVYFGETKKSGNADNSSFTGDSGFGAFPETTQFMEQYGVTVAPTNDFALLDADPEGTFPF